MCRPVACKTCGKTTWAGCGQHIDQVKASVPVAQWCAGHPEQKKNGLFGRIMGR
ncbi:hypothetical protein ACTQ49_07310 [Luteococcus sp. Sow4_B9]|uniref:hypothetical protein n=1 Tax=Luteococcus sp. Sow4_B9 TaxID=3438792 RepID=UPI003F97C927